MSECKDSEFVVKFFLSNTETKYLSDSFHWPLAVHLKDTTLCCAGHPQLMPCVHTDLLFTPVAQITTYDTLHRLVRIYNSDEKVKE